LQGESRSRIQSGAIVLQLLLENAVKHNVISAQNRYKLEFTSKAVLVIQNDYQKKEVLQDRQGVDYKTSLIATQ
jgi:LytS/YehU family sensor histidine kinase